jgi:hypothetical protein
MTQQASTSGGAESSVNDNAPTAVRGKRSKKPPSGKRRAPHVYPTEIEDITQKIKKIRGQELKARVEIGLELSRAKNFLGHGRFLPWVRREFSWSTRTATDYMNLAPYEGKTAKFADLDLGTALALVTDSTLEKVREEVFERAEKGEKLARKDVRKQIAEVKATQPKRLAKAKAIKPSATTGDEAFLATTGKSPAEEVAEALLNLLHAAEKNRLHCTPNDVAVWLMDEEYKRVPMASSECFGFVSSITQDLLRMPESQLKLVS